MNKNILVVEDDNSIRNYLKELLSDRGYVVTQASSGIKALELLEKSQIDLALLDLTLPDISGETICQECRKRFPEVKIIILTAKEGVQNIVHGLQMGADDYITKPFTIEELLARIQARLRSAETQAEIIKIKDLEINSQIYTVTKKGKQIDLTPQEFKLLHFLAINKNKVMTRDIILSKIWFFSPEVDTRVVDVYIGYLRKKIELPSEQKIITSVRGFGYMLKA